MGIATKKSHLAILGVIARGHVLLLEAIFPVYIAKRRMCLYKVYTAVDILGWASQTSAPKAHSCGAIARLWISITGQKVNQTIFTTRTVSIPLAFFIISNGTMSTAQTAMDLLARKVRVVLIYRSDNLNPPAKLSFYTYVVSFLACIHRVF